MSRELSRWFRSLGKAQQCGGQTWRCGYLSFCHFYGFLGFLHLCTFVIVVCGLGEAILTLQSKEAKDFSWEDCIPFSRLSLSFTG